MDNSKSRPLCTLDDSNGIEGMKRKPLAVITTCFGLYVLLITVFISNLYTLSKRKTEGGYLKGKRERGRERERLGWLISIICKCTSSPTKSDASQKSPLPYMH